MKPFERLGKEFACSNSRLSRWEHESQIRPPRDSASPTSYTTSGCRYDVTKSSPGISFCYIYSTASQTIRGIALICNLLPGYVLFRKLKSNNCIIQHIKFSIKLFLRIFICKFRDSFYQRKTNS